MPLRPRHLVLLVTSIVGVFTCGWRLDVLHLRGDEIYYRAAAIDILHGEWLTNAQHPPLVKELMALSRLALGDTLIADRLPAAMAAWSCGLVVALLVWRTGRPGPWSVTAGVVGALLWWTLPFAPGRVATLESVTALLVVAAQLGWVHALTRTDPRWLLPGGALTGFAAAGKLTGGIALVGMVPAVLLLGRRAGGRRVLPFALGAVVLATLTWLLPFVPMEGDALTAMTTPVTFQLDHAEVGHTVVVAGEIHEYAPWWATTHFFREALGTPTTAGLLLAAGLGWSRHPEVATPVAVTFLGYLAVISVSPVQLAHYHYVVWPLLVVLAVCSLAPGRPSRAPLFPGSRRAGASLTVAGAVALLPAVPVAAAHVTDVATEEPTGLGLAEQTLAEEGVPDDAAVLAWTDPRATRAAMPEQRLTQRMPPGYTPRALIVSPSWSERRPHMDLDLWRQCRSVAYDEHDLGGTTLHIRAEDLPTSSPEPDPACGALLGD